tara:strand:+ start:1558 stop:1947 length:390 start_codon:yes stop_codon:yes gene_type:complete
MVHKLIHATQARSGTTILIDGVACTIRSNDLSTSGRHGHAKCRIEAMGIIDGKKKVIVVGGHDRLEVPMINKNNGQILSIGEDKASVMDLTSYETIELPISKELKEQVKDGDQVEYWDIEGSKLIKRKV